MFTRKIVIILLNIDCSIRWRNIEKEGYVSLAKALGRVILQDDTFVCVNSKRIMKQVWRVYSEIILKHTFATYLQEAPVSTKVLSQMIK